MRWTIATLSAALLLAGCAPHPAPKKLVLTGSSTIAPLAVELGKRFETRHPGVRVDVQSGGSSRGVADVRQGLSDIGLVSRGLKDDEKDLSPFLLARDGICVILHKDNAVTELSDEQVVSIYTGKTVNWKDVGGKDAPITVVNKAEGRSTLELFCHYYKLKPAEIQAHVVIGDSAQGIKTVAGQSNAIGYVSIGNAEYEAKQGTAIKLLPCKGVTASIESVTKGKFPLARELNLVTKKAPEDLVKEFLDWAQSDKVHDLIRDQYFVPVPRN
ncbi:MAG: phosphate ABC transporter substrate-binding protein [Planctomycetaceae bacterium]|nr:phosphate ABC transporter substrate-binding protein [Planctomycetaceae bacterium]